MLSKTIISSAALAATVAAYDLPVCWSSCFEKYEVESQGCLCKDGLSEIVSSCVASGCSESDNSSYETWLASYCHAAPVSSNTWPVPSSTYAIPSSSAAPSEPPVYSEPSTTSETWSAPPPYTTTEATSSSSTSTAPSETYPVSTSSSSPITTSPYSSICTESTTMIWRSTTMTAPITITHFPGGGWATYSAGNATSAASPTGGASPPAYSGPPATGGAAKIGAAVAAVFGGVVAMVL